MICLGCQQKIMDNVESCPFCSVKYNAEKLRFIKYLGDADSLVGYQKSYKLILLKNIFEFIQAGEELSVDKIMYKIKEFYLNRVHNGLPADYEVDSRIKNITENTTIYDIWAVFKANPYNVINNQGFLFLEKNSRGELIFILPDDIVMDLTQKECDNFLALIDKKLDLYYSKYSGGIQFKEGDVGSGDVLPKDNSYISEATNEPIKDKTIKIIPIEKTRLSVRSKHCLMRSGYMTVQDIIFLGAEDLYHIRNMGQKSVEEILGLIADYNNGRLIYDEPTLAEESIEIGEMDLNCSLQDTRLSVRAKNVLGREGYKVVGDIIAITEEQLYSFRNVGHLTVKEILEFAKNSRYANNLDSGEDERKTSVLLQSIKSTNLSTRAKNALQNGGYQVVGDILDLTEPELCELPKVGANTVEEILLFSITLKQTLADNSIGDSERNGESIKYPYFEISTECENIPVPVLSYFGMQPSLIRKLQGQGIYKLGQLKQMDYSQIRASMGSDWNKLLHFTLKEFFDGAIIATKLFLDNISQEEDLSFIVARSRGATLQELGDKRGLTREGVRQHIEKPLKFIKPVAVCLAKALIDKVRGKYLTLQDIYDVYDNDDYDAIISYALNESEEIETIDSLGLYFIKDNVSYNAILSQAIAEYVGEGVFWKREIATLVEILQEKNLSFVDLSDVWFYMLSQGYKVYGEYVVPHTVPYGNLLAIIIDEDFPNGISFSDESEVALLRERAYVKFGELNLPKEDRPLSARVIDLLVLCDRGRWISPNRVFIDISTLETVKAFIDESEQNIIYYQALFNQFEGLLSMTSDVFNYHYLHGVLKYYYGSEYSFNRDYLQKETGVKTGNLESRIYEYISSKGEAVSRKELKEHLKISSDIMISNVIAGSRNIFQWEFNYYNCLGNVDIQKIEEEFLNEIITEMFAENQNYCSAKMVFEYCQQLMPELLERNCIKNATNLFYLVATLMGDKYKYRIPHILPQDSLLSTTEDIARMFVQNPKTLKWDEFSTMSERYGWGQSTAVIIFESLTKDNYYRISRTEYLRKEELIISREDIMQIVDILKMYLSDKEYVGVWEIKFNRFPNIGYEWTAHLLEAVVSCYIRELKIITPSFGSNKTERGLYVPFDSELTTFDEVVLKVMRNSDVKSLTESEMYTMLVLSGVIKNSIPNELKESQLIEFKDGVYTIKESV